MRLLILFLVFPDIEKMAKGIVLNVPGPKVGFRNECQAGSQPPAIGCKVDRGVVVF